MYAIINGELLPKEEAKILITDLAVQRGYGIFDFFRTVNSQPLFAEDHLDRFYHSAQSLHLPVQQSREQLKSLIDQLVKQNGMADSGIRITLTGGYSEDGYLPAAPNLLITQSPFTFTAAGFEKGIALLTHEYQRQLPETKTIDYIQAIYLQPSIKEKNANDVLYYAGNAVTECPRSNFFMVTKNDEVITPAKNVLKGITRKRILSLTGFNIKEGHISPADIINAKEAFISSTTKKVMPVVAINGKTIGNGQPGAITRAIFERLHD